MTVSTVKLKIDFNNVVLLKEHSAFSSKMCVITEDYVFPNPEYIALPALILSWLLKEMRLIVGKNNTIQERHIYFYPEDGYYIFLQYNNEDGTLTLKLTKRIIKKRFNVLHTVFSNEGKLETVTKQCYFNQFFTEVYNQAVKFHEKYKNSEIQGFDMLALEGEIKHAKKLVTKIAGVFNN